MIATAVLIAACGGSGDLDRADAGLSDPEGVGAGPATREVTQVVVIGAQASSLDAIRTALAEYDVGPALEQVMVVGAPSCQETSTDLILCWSEVAEPEPTTGRRVLVVLDGRLAAAAEAVEAIGGELTTMVAGDPSEAASALARASSSIIFVPGGLSEQIADPVVTLLVGVNDALAAYEPVILGDDHAALLVTRFFDSRLQENERSIAKEEVAQDSVPEPEVRWVLDLPEPLALQGSHERAVVVDGVVAFLGNDGVVRGVDTDDGTLLWSREISTGPAPAGSFVSAAGNTLLVVSATPGVVPDPDAELPDRSLLALDVRTGDIIWEATVSGRGSVGHPATDGDRVFVWIAEDDVDISFRALNLADGREVWRTDGEGAMGLGPPRVDNGDVWVGSRDGALRGFDAATGAELARFDRIGLGLAGVASRPAVTGDRVYFGNDNGTFYAIDRASGDLVWSFATESPNLPSSPVIADDLVIFGSFDGGVYGLDLGTGEVRWRYDSAEDLFLSSAALADDGTIYIASLEPPASLLALDASTGDVVWQLPIGEQTGASPFVDGDTVYIQTPRRFMAVAR